MQQNQATTTEGTAHANELDVQSGSGQNLRTFLRFELTGSDTLVKIYINGALDVPRILTGRPLSSSGYWLAIGRYAAANLERARPWAQQRP